MVSCRDTSIYVKSAICPLSLNGIVRLTSGKCNMSVHQAYSTDEPASTPVLPSSRPPEIISHCVWLYFRFALSYRDVEEIMAVRGLSHL